jgi:superfamily II DNA/RNA helicase
MFFTATWPREVQTIAREFLRNPVEIKFGDVHIPYHDNDALELMFTKFEEENVDSILINGDLLDFYQLSFHEKDPRNVHFKQEIEAGKTFLSYIRNK